MVRVPRVHDNPFEIPSIILLFVLGGLEQHLVTGARISIFIFFFFFTFRLTQLLPLQISFERARFQQRLFLGLLLTFYFLPRAFEFPESHYIFLLDRWAKKITSLWSYRYTRTLLCYILSKVFYKIILVQTMYQR
jgi:hypothetical protein